MCSIRCGYKLCRIPFARKYLLLIIFCVVIYNEHLVYVINALQWRDIKCVDHNSCLRIMLVADPQILGKHNEKVHFLTPLAIFDSDRFVKNTFMLASDFVKPDVIVFLGDLMDEGSTASDEEFYQYVRRLFHIFENKFLGTKHIWLPGDNDIGGEANDRVTVQKTKRFLRAFEQPDIIAINNITFMKINRLTFSIPVYKKERDFYNTNEIIIGLSHIPMMFMPSPFVDKVFKKLLPQLLFTAHEHKSMIVSTNALLRQDRHVIAVTPDSKEIFEYELGQSDMYEIIIPTCSYRMGTNKMGYGFATIEKSTLKYTVLWSPTRFQSLFYYFVIFIIIFLYGVVYANKMLIRAFKKRNTNKFIL